MSVHPNSLANLKPARRGEIRNPKGNNRYTADRARKETFEAVCLALAEAKDEGTRDRLLRRITQDVFDGALTDDSQLLRAVWVRLWDYG